MNYRVVGQYFNYSYLLILSIMYTIDHYRPILRCGQGL